MAEAKQSKENKSDVYYPFRQNLFGKEYKDKKFKYQGIARGLKWRQGYPTTKIGRFAGTFRSSGHKNPRLMNKAMARLKQKTNKSRQKYPRPGRKFVVSVIRETVGWAPYERRIMELLRSGNPKKALKFAKKRLGSHARAKSKRAKMERFQVAEAKIAQAKAQKAQEKAQQKAQAKKAAEKEAKKTAK
mmetsp:Transcript_44390/g.71107  ORF Transcript_44390/g.71107 Transcript_44390/m.71107 type:complete len:188 (+) Transcript_44390:123-686(+)|eukprot:CAMPEP_0197032006 /NCGR_PEP_ID=MMETSP1384-20130603/10798_1 /TAXON_ID=29189 /ORGANISM="Ammonia sp." /LENGTH=187 /DNA_ID=CAMNT_0042461599 /DNA_START=122 /DNA_END=685 /DNA_ORIENTATION=+